MAVEKTIVIKGDTKDAVKSFENLGKTIQEQIDITIEFERELQDLEKQLKETPRGSLSAQKALKGRIEGLKDALSDQKLSLKSLNNERKKASKLTKTSITDLRDNGGAISVLDSLTGGLATKVRDAAEATKLFNISLKGTRTALIATGIGVFVVALGLVVAFWDDIVEFITQANKKLQKQVDLSKERVRSLQTSLEILELQKGILEDQEKSLTEINGLISDNRKEQLKELAIQLIKLKQLDEILTARALEVTLLERGLSALTGQLGAVQVLTKSELKALKSRKDGIKETEILILKLQKAESAGRKEIRDEQKRVFDDAFAQYEKEREEILKTQQAALARLEAEKKARKELNDFINKEEQDEIDAEDARLDNALKSIRIEEQALRERRLAQLDFEISQSETDKERLGFLQQRLDFEITQAETEAERLELQKQRLDLEAGEAQTESGKLDLLRERLELENEIIIEDLEIKRQLFKEGTAERTQAEQDFLTKKQEIDNKLLDVNRRTIKQQEADEENLKNAKIQIASSTLSILGSLAKEGSALSKGIAASQATINTFQGVTAALSATSVIPDPFGTILKFANAAAIGVAGAINVKKILSTQPVTKSAPGGASGGGAPAPSFNLVAGTGSNQIAEGLATQNQPIKAFVVASDVSSGQSLDRNIISNSSL